MKFFQIVSINKFLEKTSLRFAACALSGALLFACFPSLDWNALVWVACLPLVAAVTCEQNLFRAFLLGYLSGAVFLAGSCYWFVGVMRHYGGLGPALATGVLTLFLMVFSVYYGAFGLVVAWVARRSHAHALLLSPFLWVALELARTYLITGFPWNLLGYAVRAGGLVRLASFTAVYGLSFLVVSTAALLAWVFLEPKRRWARTALGFWTALLVVMNGISTPPASAPGSNIAYLVQPNVPLDPAALERWAPWKDPAPLERLVAMTEDSRSREAPGSTAPPLVIWSENPAPFYFNRDLVFHRAVEMMARSTQAYTIVGTVNFAGPDSTLLKNSAEVLDPGGREVLEYDKIHLVPFGEYVPKWAFPTKIGKITLEVGDFVPGSTYEAAQTPQGAVSVFICYEAIFPELVRRLTPAGPGVLVNISDDAWYGGSSAAAQHLEMARFRAIENRRYLLRATNDGITAVIDAYGRVVEQLPRRRAMVLPGHFSYLGGRTFYTAYGDVFAWACVVMTVMLLAVGKRAGSKQSAEGTKP